MRNLAFLALSLLTAACGSDSSTPATSDRVAAACGKILDATCAKFVECHATKNGTPFTSDLCAQVRAQAVAECESQDGASISAASDAEVDQCASETSAIQCTDICNKVPADTPTCHELSPSPNTEVVTCSP